MIIKINGKVLLLLTAGIAMVSSAVLAAKKTPEAQQRKQLALEVKREATGDPNAQLTLIESIKAQIGSYAPSIISGMVALGSLTGSEIINNENMKRAERAFNDYKGMTKRLGGEGTSKVIEKAVEQKKLYDGKNKSWEAEEYYRIVFQGRSIQFQESRSNVMRAIYELNRRFHERGFVTFNFFLKLLNQDPVPEGNTRGWEVYIGEHDYGYSWIDVGLKECEDEPWVTEIFFACYPHFVDEEDVRLEAQDSDYVMKLTKGEVN